MNIVSNRNIHTGIVGLTKFIDQAKFLDSLFINLVVFSKSQGFL